MYDKTTFELPVSISKYGKGNEFVRYNIPFTRQEGNLHYEGWYKTLRVLAYWDKIEISNSLASFIYGHNGIDVSHSQVSSIIDELCDVFECSSDNLKVKSTEFGFTIPTEIAPHKINERLIFHRNKEPLKFFRNDQLTEIKFKHSHYSLKGYDKRVVEHFENGAQLVGNWFRFEMQLKRAFFQYKKFRIDTATDLISRDIIKQLFDVFIRDWRLIKKAPTLTPKNLSENDRYRIYAKLNPLYWSDNDEYKNDEAIKKERYRFFEEELEMIGDFSMFQEIEKQFTQKFEQLMDSSFVPEIPTFILGEKEGHFNSRRQETITV